MSDLKQQQLEGQTIQVQISHNGQEQIHSQGMQNMQNSPSMASIPSQGGTATITTMSAGPPQQLTDWSGSARVQVIQQPYIQPVAYNAQGQLIVPGNIALHPGHINQPIQIVTAGKYQQGQAPQVLTTTHGKHVIQGHPASYHSYSTSGNNQTLVLSPMGVLGQGNVQQQQGKPQEVQKVISKTTVGNSIKHISHQHQNVSMVTSQPQTVIQPQILGPIQYTCNNHQHRTVHQGTAQTMQFTPWQATFSSTGLPQGLTWAPGTIPGSTLVTQGGQVFIRHPQQEQAGMYIQNNQSSGSQTNQGSSQNINKSSHTTENSRHLQPSKPASTKTFSNILPNNADPEAVKQQTSSSSSPSGQSPQQVQQQQSSLHNVKSGQKYRMKPSPRLIPTPPHKPNLGHQQRQSTPVQVIQPKFMMSNPQPSMTPAPVTMTSSQEKMVKQIQTQRIPQQPIQRQQFQQIHMYPEQLNAKTQQGPVILTNGISSAGDRPLIPVMSVSPGQMTSMMGSMMVQAVPGVATVAPSIPLNTASTVRTDSTSPERMTMPNQTTSKNTSTKSPAREKEVILDFCFTSGDAQNSLSSEATMVKCINSSFDKDKISVRSNKDREKEQERESEKKKEKEKEEKKERDKNGERERERKTEKDKGKEKDKDKASRHAKATLMVKPQVLTHVIEGFVIQESSEPFPMYKNSTDSLIRKISDSEALENGESPSKKSTMNNIEEAVDESDKVNPSRWTVAEVCEFIKNLPGCSDYVDEFAVQDIDGEALMLLKPDHLITAMSMKLGPAIKIIAKIDTMRANPSSKEIGH